MKAWRRFCCLAWCLPLAVAATPALSLPDIGTKRHQVDEFIGHGRWTVVAIWSVDCIICQREIPEIAFFHDEHKNKDATVLGISIDGLAQRARVQGFIDQHALGFPNLVAERGDIAALGAGAFQGTPTYLFFSPAGELVTRRLGATTLAEIERTISLTPTGGAGKR